MTMAVYSMCLGSKLTFKPDDLRGTLEKISSANVRVSVVENPNSTSFPTKSAGEVACLAAKPKKRLLKYST
jgi:hypothetical protein